MLDSLRRGAKSFVAKILFAILILSFAVWGVGDVVRSYGDGAVAHVGPTEITAAEFQQAYQSQVDNVRRRFGTQLTAEQIRAFGFDQQVLSQLIGAAAIDTHTTKLGLALSDEAIAAAIERDPTFRGPDGKFSRIAMQGLLRQAGLNEPVYLGMRRKDELREIVTGALAEGLVVPTATIEMIHRYREETRSVERVTIDPKTAITLPPLDEAKLKDTYEQNKRSFMTPEYRTIAVLSLTLDEMKARVAIDEEAVKRAYEQDKARYDVAERRRIEQIAFKDRAAAQTALGALRGGKPFLEVAADAGAKPSDVDLGTVTKAEMIDPKIAEAAFAVEKDKVSDVVEGQFATVIVRATAIEPGKTSTLESAAPQIREALASAEATQKIRDQHDVIERLRIDGKSLREIAEQEKLTLLEIAATDKNGLTPQGTPAFPATGYERAVARAFETRVGLDGDAVDLPNGGQAWVDVVGVTPETQKPFEQVRAEVETLWTDLETAKLVTALANTLVERATKGEPLEALATVAGGKVETTTRFRRFGAATGLAAAAVQRAFALPVGGVAAVEAVEGKTRTLLKVTEVTPAPAATADQIDRLRSEIARQREGDAVAEYVAALRDQYGVTINNQVFRRVTGAEQ